MNKCSPKIVKNADGISVNMMLLKRKKVGEKANNNAEINAIFLLKIRKRLGT